MPIADGSDRIDRIGTRSGGRAVSDVDADVPSTPLCIANQVSRSEAHLSEYILSWTKRLAWF